MDLAGGVSEAGEHRILRAALTGNWDEVIERTKKAKLPGWLLETLFQALEGREARAMDESALRDWLARKLAELEGRLGNLTERDEDAITEIYKTVWSERLF